MGEQHGCPGCPAAGPAVRLQVRRQGRRGGDQEIRTDCLNQDRHYDRSRDRQRADQRRVRDETPLSSSCRNPYRSFPGAADHDVQRRVCFSVGASQTIAPLSVTTASRLSHAYTDTDSHNATSYNATSYNATSYNATSYNATTDDIAVQGAAGRQLRAVLLSGHPDVERIRYLCRSPECRLAGRHDSFDHCN